MLMITILWSAPAKVNAAIANETVAGKGTPLSQLLLFAEFKRALRPAQSYDD